MLCIGSLHWIHVSDDRGGLQLCDGEHGTGCWENDYCTTDPPASCKLCVLKLSVGQTKVNICTLIYGQGDNCKTQA